MNVEEPDKFEQFMSSVRQTGEVIGEGLQWLGRNVETVAIVSAVPIMVLTVLVIARARARRRNPKVSGMRHASR